MTEIIPYQPTYDAEIRALLKLTVSSDISLALEREPDYMYGTHIQCERPEVYLALVDGKVMAVCNVGFRRVWINGKIEWGRYLCDLRVHPDKQKSMLFMRMGKFLTDLMRTDEFPAQTVIFSDNAPMIKLAEKSKRNNSVMASYHFVEHIENFILPYDKKASKKQLQGIRKANDSDIPRLQAFYDEIAKERSYMPYYDFSALHNPYFRDCNISDFLIAERDGAIIGLLGVWDLKGIKQTRVASYSNRFKLVRPFYNLYARLTNRVLLPKAGSVLRYLYLHTIVVKDGDRAVFSDLLDGVSKHCMDGVMYDSWLCSLLERDPLLPVLTAKRNAFRTRGNYYLCNTKVDIDAEYLENGGYLEGARI